MTSKAKKNELKLMHQNIQGYSGKEDEIQNYLQTSNIDILCLTEHWQTDQEPKYRFENYEVASSFCRKDHVRGGSTIIVKSGLMNQMENTCKRKIENLTQEKIIELSCVEMKNQIVICAYTPSVAMYNQFEPVMKEALKVASDSGKFVTVCGDFNVDLLRESSKRTRIINLFNESGLKYLFQEPTRVTRNTATCIDNIFSNCDYTNKVITNRLKSDHSGQVVTFAVKHKKDEYDLNNNYLLATITCDLCDRSFTAKTGYLSHLRAHERHQNIDLSVDADSNAHDYNLKNGVLTCPQCERTFTAKSGFLSHMRAHKRHPDTDSDSEPEVVQPNRRNKSSTGASNSRQDNNSEITCKYAACGRTFESGAGYASHLRAHERQANEQPLPRTKSPSTNIYNNRDESPTGTSYSRQDDNSVLKCKYSGCGRTFESGAGYASHLRAHERQANEQPLPRTKSPSTNIYNNRDKSPTGTSYSRQDDNSVLKCKYSGCGRTFESGAGYASHLRAHERQANEQPLPRTKSPSTNIYNNRDESPTGTSYSRQDDNSVLKCKYSGCGRTFESGAGYASHLRAHERQVNEQPLPRTKSPSTNIYNNRDDSPTGTSYSRQDDNSVLKCKYSGCGRTFESGAGYASHLRAHERQANEQPLPRTKSPSTNIYDNRDESPTGTSTPYSRRDDYSAIKCQHAGCGRTFESGAGYASHLRAHERGTNTQAKALVTVRSEIPFRNSVSRQTSESFGSKTDYVCCGRTFTSGAGYASHMRSHEREKAEPAQYLPRDNYKDMSAQINSGYSCCGRTFASGAGYASHMRSHERERVESSQSSARNDYNSYGASFSPSVSRQNFGSSIGVQSGGYFCCGRSFASGAGYASHMRSHARN